MGGEGSGGAGREPRWGDERHTRSGSGDKDCRSFMALRGINGSTQSAVATTVMSLAGQGAVMMSLICEFYFIGWWWAGRCAQSSAGWSASPCASLLCDFFFFLKSALLLTNQTTSSQLHFIAAAVTWPCALKTTGAIEGYSDGRRRSRRVAQLGIREVTGR